jgi:hypothetical protein
MLVGKLPRQRDYERTIRQEAHGSPLLFIFKEGTGLCGRSYLRWDSLRHVREARGSSAY